MWYAQILNSLEVDDFSEELLQDITNHLQSISVTDFSKGYQIIVIELADMGYEFMSKNQLPSTQLIIQYLQLWNQEVCTFSNLWVLQNLEIAYQIKINRITQARARLLALHSNIQQLILNIYLKYELLNKPIVIDEQQYYSIGGTVSQIYESALSLYNFCTIDNQSKQQALQAILKLQQLIIKSLEPKLDKKVHLLMAKLYERMAQLEKGTYESNQFCIQAYKVASQVLTSDDSLLQYYESHIQIDNQQSQPPKPLSITHLQENTVLLEERDVVISDQAGSMRVTYNHKAKELTILFLNLKCIFNLSDIENEITIFNLQSLPVFLNEFVNVVSQQLILEETLIILTNIVALESFEKQVQITQKTRGHYFAYFTEQVLDYMDDESVQPLLIQ